MGVDSYDEDESTADSGPPRRQAIGSRNSGFSDKSTTSGEHNRPSDVQDAEDSRSESGGSPKAGRSLQLQLRPRSPESGSVYNIDFDANELAVTDEPLPKEWVQPKTTLEDGTATELVVAHSVQHRVSKSKPDKIALVCSSEPLNSDPTSIIQDRESQDSFRWL